MSREPPPKPPRHRPRKKASGSVAVAVPSFDFPVPSFAVSRETDSSEQYGTESMTSSQQYGIESITTLTNFAGIVECPECDILVEANSYHLHHLESHPDIAHLKYQGTEESSLITRNHEDGLFHCPCGDFTHEDPCVMHYHASINCEIPEILYLQQMQESVGDLSYTFHTEQEADTEQQSDIKPQVIPPSQQDRDVKITNMVEEELVKWEHQLQSFKSKTASISQQHEEQSHNMNEQFENLIDRFYLTMQDQAQYSHDIQKRLRLLLHSLSGNTSALLSTRKHLSLSASQEEKARRDWIRLLVKHHFGNKLDKGEIKLALQVDEIDSDIAVPNILNMIDYVLALIFESDTNK
ncbi:hypothetical protein K492DRAFT_198990 [Lichtheimia hyalospora FSU 10163]|nr:hypothetical protein K492DRAFT_198990 [Lichtheimia hyalospora FSU 10163]